MITGTEIDFIVSDSLKALALYKEIFEVHVVEATKYPVGTVSYTHLTLPTICSV